MRFTFSNASLAILITRIHYLFWSSLTTNQQKMTQPKGKKKKKNDPNRPRFDFCPPKRRPLDSNFVSALPASEGQSRTKVSRLQAAIFGAKRRPFGLPWKAKRGRNGGSRQKSPKKRKTLYRKTKKTTRVDSSKLIPGFVVGFRLGSFTKEVEILKMKKNTFFLRRLASPKRKNTRQQKAKQPLLSSRHSLTLESSRRNDRMARPKRMANHTKIITIENQKNKKCQKNNNSF